MNKNVRYKNQKEEKYRKTIIISIAFLVAILLVFLIALSSISAIKKQNEQIKVNGNFSSIQEILEYYGCKFIKTKDSSEENFYQDIYTIFKYELYEDEKSNEKFYDNVINQIAKFYNYKSFKLIDENKSEKIEIKVVCDGKKVKTIYINGIEDYFIFMDSQISLRKYKELKKVDISVQSPELINCIQNGWNTNVDFGTRETIFQNYFIYFDEGIKTRKINGKIYNIIFTNKYQNQVVNGFTVGTESDIIISKLGTPTFKNKDGSIIGYKSDNLYVFFEKDQISIYRNIEEEGFDEFFKLVDDFLDEKYTLLEFMNELTYLWPDYEEYKYTEDSVFLSYPNKGIDIKMNYDNMDGIILYNNIGVNQQVVNKYLEHTEFVAQLQIDNIYNAEERRVNRENQINQNCKEYKEQFEKDDNRNHSNIYDYYMKMSNNDKIMGVYFISKDGQNPNCELSESIGTYIWLNDYCFIYSVDGKGLYYYDLQSQTRGILKTGDEEFKIESYENGILKYDDNTIQIQY